MSGILAMMTGGAPADLVVDISNKASPDIPALVQAAGWVGTSQPIRLVNTGLVNTLKILAGALSGADITLVNAAGVRIGGASGGGTALTLRIPVKIQNLGIISGGGGNGGAGASAWISRVNPNGATVSATGYGGAGRGGRGFIHSASLTIIDDVSAVYPGTTGTLSATGSFGGGSGRDLATARGGDGGTGGTWGQAGSAGDAGSISGDYDTGSPGTPGAGQPAGHYIDGASFATWLATGTRQGLSK